MKREETEVEGGIRLAIACCVVYIQSSYSLRFTVRTSVTLMKAMLLKPNANSRKCADYDQLVSVHLVSQQWHRFVFIVRHIHFLGVSRAVVV